MKLLLARLLLLATAVPLLCAVALLATAQLAASLAVALIGEAAATPAARAVWITRRIDDAAERIQAALRMIV